MSESKNEFVHLHGHSYFSNELQPDALSSPEELVDRAVELGLDSICLTDHGSVTGVPRLVKAAEKKGVKPIVGSELYVCDDPARRPEKGERDYQHVVALARNWEGYVELLGLLTKANSEAQFYRRPRNSYDQILGTKNLVFLTACAGGVLSRTDWMDKALAMHAALNRDSADPRFYVEIQPHDVEAQWIVNQRAQALCEDWGVPVVATQDFHYAKPGDNVSHEVLLAIGSKSVWSDPDRWRYPVSDLHIKSKAEMVRAFIPHIRRRGLAEEVVVEAIRNARAIGDRLDFKWRTLPVSLPDMGADPERQLMEKCVAAMKAKGLMGNPAYVERLQHEFRTIKACGFLPYFLMLADIIGWARSRGIMVGPARGSSGGSLVCYLIGITQIDPLKHGLLFERFYRPGRVDLPDIDTDFEDERREEVLAYIRRRFGEDRVAGVANYVTLGAKSAIRDVARTFEIDMAEVNRATVPVDNTLEDDKVWDQQTVRPFLDKHPIVEAHAKRLCGVMRGTGQHAAGVVIAGEPLAGRAVIWRKDERHVVNWDKDIIESLGLMKLDVLGLRTLSILRHAAEHAFRMRGVRIDYTQIPLDDPKALQIFQSGLTTGVFQFESHGMRRLLQSLKIDRFSVIADANALYRPGPMELIPQYTAAQTGIAPPRYAHPLLEPILSETYGIIVYQEQMMRIFVDMGGFTYAEADQMRKIVGKKLGPDEFMKHEGDFVAGAAAKGVDPAVAKAVFGQMVAFAGYAFNKSHAVAYSIIAFWCAWMKAHHPAAFYAAHLSNSDEVQTMLAIEDAQRQGIKVLMPDVNESAANAFIPLNDTVLRAPLSAIKGVGEKAAALIVGAREGRLDHNGLGTFDTREEKNGVVAHDSTFVRKAPFDDGADFLRRVYKRIVNVKVQRLLRECGALPWDLPDADALHKARQESLGAIYRDVPAVDPGATLTFDEFAQRSLARAFADMDALGAATKMASVYPSWGSKPRLMLVFDKPGRRDAMKRSIGENDMVEVVVKLLRETLRFTRRDLYVTSLFKFNDPPLGYDSIEADCAKILKAEIETTKPPVIVAFGKAPVEFFCGKGVRVNEVHGKVIVQGKRPIVLAKSPYLIYRDNEAAARDPARDPEFLKVVDALNSVYA